MNNGQRAVLVVALGAVSWIAAGLAIRLLANADGAWFGYAPGTEAVFTPDGTWPIWREALVWSAATAIWAGVSLWLFRSTEEPED